MNVSGDVGHMTIWSDAYRYCRVLFSSRVRNSFSVWLVCGCADNL